MPCHPGVRQTCTMHYAGQIAEGVGFSASPVSACLQCDLLARTAMADIGCHNAYFINSDTI